MISPQSNKGLIMKRAVITGIGIVSSIGNNQEEDRLGISISGVRLAVKRNRLKRIIKEFYRKNRSFPSQVAGEKFPTKKTDMIIATRRHFLPNSLADLNKALTMCLQKGQSESIKVRKNPEKIITCEKQ